MRIKSMRIKGFKSLKDVYIDEFDNFCILVGKNNSGKSAILQVLKILSRKWGIPEIKDILTHGKKSAQIEIVFSISDIERDKIIDIFSSANRPELKESGFSREIKYCFQLTEDKQILNSAVYLSDVDGEHISISERKDTLRMARDKNIINNLRMNNNIKGIPQSVISGGDPFNTGDKKFFYTVLIKRFWKELRFLSASRASKGKYAVRKEELEETAVNLPAVLLDIRGSNPKSFTKIVELATEIEPDIGDILTHLEETNTFTALSHKNGKQVKLEHSGKGIEQVLTMACLIVMNDDGTILIEEPESNLHASAAESFFNFLKEESKKKQIIITTHSSIFTDSEDGIRTFLLDKIVKEGTHITYLKGNELKIIKRVLGSRNRHFFLPELIVLIEGDSEECALPEIAKSMKIKTIEKCNIELINVTGNGNFKVKKIKEYLRYLNDMGFVPFIIADKDVGIAKEISELVKQGYLQDDMYIVWGGEFEDCFDETMIIAATKQIASENNIEFDIEASELKKEKGEGKTTYKALHDLIHNKGIQLSISKVELAKAISNVINEEIKSGKKRNETEPEKAIKRLDKICKKI